MHLERNRKDFIESDITKSEIDIITLNKENKIENAIELKYPKKSNGKVPEEMFSFIMDLKFLEELKEFSINSNYFLAITDNHLFWKGDKKDGIYKYFRKSHFLDANEEIIKPAGVKSKSIALKNNYRIEWKNIESTDYKYLLIEIK